MGVSLILSPSRPDGMIGAPCGAAALSVDGADRRIWLNETDAVHDEGWIWVLHELEHVVFWHPTRGVDFNEALMMPWGVAALRACRISAAVYFGSPYTAMTTIDCYADRRQLPVDWWKCPWNTAWYRLGADFCRAFGAIDNRGLPTWRYPDWSAVNPSICID